MLYHSMCEPMKNFMIQYGRFFLLAFALGFMMPRLSPVLLKTSVTDYSSAENLDALIVGYHLQMNEITNGYIERLLELEDPDVLYPPSDEECDEENLSTFCLASALNQSLTAFEKELMARKSELEDLSAQSQDLESDEEGGVLTLEDALLQAKEQQSVIEDQMQSAEDALDLTLAVYNQLQVVYPLHQEMLTFRTNLESFRDNLSLVRNVIELYPSRFNGATTAQCK